MPKNVKNFVNQSVTKQYNNSKNPNANFSNNTIKNFNMKQMNKNCMKIF